MKISVYLSVFRDIDFVPIVIERIYDLVDEIVIIDGPYRWVKDFYEGLGLDQSSRLPEVMFRGTPLLSHAKVRHFYEIWGDQYEKRIFGYRQCRGDVVLLVDSDELVTIDRKAVEDFYSSNADVGSLSITNLVRSNVHLGTRWERVGKVGEPRVHRLFKRQSLSAAEHMDYLWQVIKKPKQESERVKVRYRPLLGHLYNLVLMRPSQGQFIKFLHYRAGHHLKQGTEDQILQAGGWKGFEEMLEQISKEEYTDLFLRMALNTMKCPVKFLIEPYQCEDNTIQTMLEPYDDVQEEYGSELPRPIIALPAVPVFAYLKPETSDLLVSVDTESVNKLKVVEHLFYFGHKRPSRHPIQPQTGHIGNGSFTFKLKRPEDPQRLFARILSFTPQQVDSNFGRIMRISCNTDEDAR